MNVKEVAPFLRVRDMKNSIRYYVDGLGFISSSAGRWKANRTSAGLRSVVRR